MMAASGSSEDAHLTALFSSLVDIDRNREKSYEMWWCLSFVDKNEPSYETHQERLRQAKDWVNEPKYSGLW